MMGRRNPLAETKPDALLYRPAKNSKAKRNREWDRAQRADPETCQISLRGVPRSLNRRLNEIAQEKGVTVSHVAVQLLEWAFEAYDRHCADAQEVGAD